MQNSSNKSHWPHFTQPDFAPGKYSNFHKTSLQPGQHLTKANGSVIGITTWWNQRIWLVQLSSVMPWLAVHFLPHRVAPNWLRSSSVGQRMLGPGAFAAAHRFLPESSCCSYEENSEWIWTSCSAVGECINSYSSQERPVAKGWLMLDFV